MSKVRSLEDADIIEKAEFSESILGKNLEEISLDQERKRMYVIVEQLDNLREKMEKSGAYSQEEIREIEEIKAIMEENIENTREIEERQNYILNHEREIELEKDYDGDGLSNREEIMKGYDPFNYDSNSNGKSDLEEEMER